MKRRDFLRKTIQTAAVAAAAGSTPGCATFDRLFSLEKENLENEVVIIGAGAAGLMAGLELKKRKIPFRIFEASERVGGRIYSLTENSESNQVVELGAEFFEGRHQVVFDLLRELNIEPIEVEANNSFENLMIYSQNRWWPSTAIQKNFKNLSAQIFKMRLKIFYPEHQKNRQQFIESPQAQGFDQVNVLELWRRQNVSIDPFWMPYLEAQSLQQLGAGLSEVSGLSWLLQGEKEDLPRQQYRISGGFQQLTYNMFGKLSGVIPEYRVHFQSPLIKIQKTNSGFELSFQTPQGIESYKSKYVILALPFNQLKKIDGLTNLGIGDNKSRAILALRTSRATKHNLLFKDPFWKNKTEKTPANKGRWVGGPVLESSWDASWSGSKKGLLSVLRHKKILNPEISIQDEMALIVKEMMLMYPKLQNQISENSFSLNWSQKKYIEGDSIIYQPGQASQFAPTIWSSDFEKSLQWAGEYTHATDFGTVAGALSSGKKAAYEISEIYRFEGA